MSLMRKEGASRDMNGRIGLKRRNWFVNNRADKKKGGQNEPRTMESKETGLDIFEDLEGFQNEMNRLFNGTLHRPGKGSLFRSGEKGNGGALWAPAVDIIDEKDDIRVRADLPGMKKEEIEVSVNNDTLSIKGEKREEKGDQGKGLRQVRTLLWGFSPVIYLAGWRGSAKKSTPRIKTASLRSLFPSGKMPKPKQIKVDIK